MGKSSEQFIMQKQFELMEMSSRELKDYANTQLEAILKHSEPNEVLSKSVRLEKYLTEHEKHLLLTIVLVLNKLLMTQRQKPLMGTLHQQTESLTPLLILLNDRAL